MNTEPRFSIAIAAKLLLMEIPMLKGILRATHLSHHYEAEGNIGAQTMRALRSRFYDAS